MKGALIALVLIAVVATVGIIHTRKTNIEARREAFALLGHQKDVYEKLGAIEKDVSNTMAIAEQGSAYIPMGSNLVVELLGEGAFPKPVKYTSAATPRAGAAGASGAAARATEDNPAGLMTREQLERRRTGTAGGVTEARPTPRVAPRPPPPEPPSESGKITEDNPGGLMTREQLERLRSGKGRDEAPKPAPAAVKAPEPVRPAAPAPVAPPPPPARPAGPEEPIMIMFRQLQADVGAQQETAQKCGEVGAQARSIYEDVLAAKTSSNANLKVEAVTPLVGESAKMREVALKQLDGIKKRYEGMGKEKVRVEEDRRARAEAERKRQEEDAHRALVAAEIQRGSETHRAVLGEIKKFNFKEALETAKGFQEQMKTQEGKDATQPGVDLCTRLVDFKKFLIEQISAEPYRWGWGDGASARDIIGAAEEGVRHSSGVAAWPEISQKQLLKIIEHYVNNEKLPAKTRGEQCLGAALLLRDIGAEEPADLFGRRAAQHVPSLESEFTRLK